MKERPILFSAPMVRAILEGRKTQTRRVVKPQPCIGHGRRQLTPDDPGWRPNENGSGWAYEAADGHLLCGPYPCPYGQPGDRLWVRETWSPAPPHRPQAPVIYMADFDNDVTRGIWKPSIHMPRWASRITLEVTGVRVERLHHISDADALAEGIQPFGDGHGYHTEEGRHYAPTAVSAFAELWTAINGPDSWDANPWVWVVEFKQLQPGGPADEQ